MQRLICENRGVIRVSGPDAAEFLQGLVSNDVAKADGSQAVYAALLTPQGKFLYDFFIVGTNDGLLLDCMADDIPVLAKKLSMYKLRADVSVDNVSESLQVGVLFGDDARDVLDPKSDQEDRDDGTILYQDPRLADAGIRVLLPSTNDPVSLGGEEATSDDYLLHRLGLGLPEAPLDLQQEKSILLESGFDELNGVDWNKGCYMGQELTARTKYRGLVKKRLVPVSFIGTPPASGADVLADGKVVGDVRSVIGTLGIALIRLDALKNSAELSADGRPLTAQIPDWMHLPNDEETAKA